MLETVEQPAPEQPAAAESPTPTFEQQRQWQEIVDRELLPHFERAYQLITAAWNAIEADSSSELRDGTFFRDQEAVLTRIHQQLLAPISTESDRIGATYGPLMRVLMSTALHDFAKPYNNSVSTLRMFARFAQQPTWTLEQQREHVRDYKQAILNDSRVTRKMLLADFEKTIQLAINGSSRPEHFADAVKLAVNRYLTQRSDGETDRYRVSVPDPRPTTIARIPANQFLESIVRELAINAFESMDERGGSVKIELAPAADGVTVVVSDTGPGMTTEVQARMFERGFTTKATGTGHGLANTRELVEDILGGRIDVDSQVGRGTTISVTVPADLSKVLAKVTRIRPVVVGSGPINTTQEAA